MIGIYKYTNKYNRKCYIGKSKDIEARYKSHLKCVKNGINTHFYNALRKYGIDSFDFQILIECPKENLDYWEKFYIRYYCSNNPDWGYNMTPGGDGISFWDEESRKRQSEIHKGKPRAGTVEDWKWSEESKEKQSKRVKEYFSKKDNRDKLSKNKIELYNKNPEIKDKIANSVSKLWQNEEYRNNYKLKMQKHFNDPNYHGNSATLKEYYRNNPEARERCKTALGRHWRKDPITSKHVYYD